MDKVIFYSYKPYLQICLHRKRGIFITFSAEGTYSPKNEEELQILRAYAEDTKGSYNISESLDPEELRRKHEEWEDSLITEAEEREKNRIEAEKKEKAEHEFYSALRFSDTVYR